MQKKKILIICPIVPFPENGAEQLDRAHGIRQLIRLGYEVRVIAKRRPYQTDSDVCMFSQSVGGIKINTVDYKFTLNGKSLIYKLGILVKRCLKFSYLDGAAFEYTDPEIQEVVELTIGEWSPDIIWFEYTYLWPLYHLALKRNIPIVTRSINFEPHHFLDEDGRGMLNYIKVLPKYISERKIIKKSSLICAITPHEAEIYQKYKAKNVIVLPLRGVHFLEKHDTREETDIKKCLNIFFMGSTYNVQHNVNAAEFIIKKIAPRLLNECGKSVHIFITGKKLPSRLQNELPVNVTYVGFVENLNDFLKEMDCAIAPSLFGAGMQQKIFEPLMRGFPVITSQRGIAGYQFVDGKDIYYANTPQEFVEKIKEIASNYEVFNSIGNSARSVAEALFEKEKIDSELNDGLKKIVYTS